MRVEVNGVRLFVDVEGSSLVPDGAVMRERPTVVLVHGGPGADHTTFKPFMSEFSENAQIIYYDHRGMGRSDLGTPAQWNLAQWADDLAGLLDALELDKPYIVGGSFGGLVAQAFARTYPQRMSKLALLGTGSRFDAELSADIFRRRGGEKAAAIARRFLSGDVDAADEYMEICLPFYQVNEHSKTDFAEAMGRTLFRPETMNHFFRPGGERDTTDLRGALARVECPTLILHGDVDPILPEAVAREMYASIPEGLGAMTVFENNGHGWGDREQDWKDALKAFLFAS